MTGKVVLVKFPFSDLESGKKRPALILTSVRVSSKVNLTQIAMISSRTEGLKFPKDILLKGWAEAGLLHSSLVRLDKIATIDTDLVDKSLGDLTPSDLAAVRKVLRNYYANF
jgi:mRNA interferase MazF